MIGKQRMVYIDRDRERAGQWIKSDYIGFVCSVCGKQIVGWATKECPHCKSKMTIGKGDEA